MNILALMFCGASLGVPYLNPSTVGVTQGDTMITSALLLFMALISHICWRIEGRIKNERH